jgi:hypothetical protein
MRDSFLSPPLLIQPQAAIHAVDTLVIPGMLRPSQRLEAFPEAPSRTFLHYGVDRLDDLVILRSFQAKIAVIGRPRNSNGSTTPLDGKRMDR